MPDSARLVPMCVESVDLVALTGSSVWRASTTRPVSAM
jgi:hypothetical protein